VSDEMLDWNSYEEKEAEVYFAPDRGNVFFASAYDGWGFRIDKFCDLYAKKLKVRKEVLQKTLWGEYYFNAKANKIYKKNVTGKMVPMFAQFVLHNIWEVYQAAAAKYAPFKFFIFLCFFFFFLFLPFSFPSLFLVWENTHKQ
jgi:ribosome assembly protein 1